MGPEANVAKNGPSATGLSIHTAKHGPPHARMPEASFSTSSTPLTQKGLIRYLSYSSPR